MKRVYPKYLRDCAVCDKPVIAKNSGFDKPNRLTCSRSCRAKMTNPTRIWTPEARAKIRAGIERTRAAGKLNHHTNPEYRAALSERYRGSKSHFWKGGLSSEKKLIRQSAEYQNWRRNVFIRDDYTCQTCGTRGGSLCADHELPFAFFPELRFEILNGRTLCVPCHKETPTFAVKSCVYL